MKHLASGTNAGTEVEPSEEFTEQVRDALLHLYDPAALQTHPLLAFIDTEVSLAGRSKRLRQILLDAIEALQPGPEAANTSHALRSYRLLELRYLEGNDVSDVMAQIALSKAQYHREHHRALQAVASILWEKWRLLALDPEQPIHRNKERSRPIQEMERLLDEIGTYGGQLVDPIETLYGIESLLRPLATRYAVQLRTITPGQARQVQGERVALRQLLLLTLAFAIGWQDGQVNESSDPGGHKGADQEAVCQGVVTATVRSSEGAIEYGIARSGAFLNPDLPIIDRWQPFLKALGGTLAVETGTIRLSVPISSPTLLVVDNNADFIALVERYLSETEWTVVGVSSVDAALAVAEHRQLSAILLDIVIPGRDGWELLVALETNPTTRAIPVVVCSVLAEPQLATTLGAEAYLPKPVDQETLIRTLNEIRREPAYSAS